MQKFFGRTFNHRTMMWEFADGSGIPFPEELRQQILLDIATCTRSTGIIALARKWWFEEQHRV
jgi:hypothetical protein